MKTLKKTGLVKGLVPLKISAKVGSYVHLDRNPFGVLLKENDWEGADYLWDVQNGGPIESVAVNVFVTGRTIQYRGNGPEIRVRVEFVGDGEPSTFASGWMSYNTAKVEDI